MKEVEVGACEARICFSALVEEAAKGQRVWITKRGKRVALLSSAAATASHPGDAADLLGSFPKVPSRRPHPLAFFEGAGGGGPPVKRAVANASFCGAWVLPDEASARAEKLLASILRQDLELWVPSVWFYEITDLLLSAHRRRRITKEAIFDGLALFASVPVRHTDVPEALARERIIRFALRFDLSAYDAAYLELADRLQAPLHTADQALRGAIEVLGSAVTLSVVERSKATWSHIIRLVSAELAQGPHFISFPEAECEMLRQSSA